MSEQFSEDLDAQSGHLNGTVPTQRAAELELEIRSWTRSNFSFTTHILQNETIWVSRLRHCFKSLKYKAKWPT